MKAIDTHVHVNFPNFSDDFSAVRQRWLAAGVDALVHACVHPGEFGAIQAIAQACPEVFFAVGLHPLEAEHQWQEALGEQIRTLAQSDSKVVAIGETGLDFYKSTAHQVQFAAFGAQLDLASDLGLPVIIHCRDAAEEMLEFLRDRPGCPAGVLHCWGGTPQQALQFVELGFHISFSGTVTFKNAPDIQESAKVVPLDRLLVETDCPFLAPVPHRGRRNEPAYVVSVLNQVAALRNLDPIALGEQTSANARQLFRLPQSIEPTVPALALA
ncbi:MAG: TatD family hydrolase [Limnothrix sp. BL-A-16]